MKNKNFFDVDHAARYLGDSLIRYEGEPIYIEEVRQENEVIIGYCRRLRNWKALRPFPLNSPKFDMNPISLGMVNWSEYGLGHHVIKVSRVPRRGWKIGLNGNNVDFAPLHPDTQIPRYRDLLHSSFLRETVLGIYPKLSTVKEKVLDKYPNSLAFSRRFAIDGNAKLYHLFSNKPVGWVDNGRNGDLVLNDQFRYLQEELDLDKDMAR